MIEDFAKAPDGSTVRRITIGSGDARAAILSWGATLQDFRLENLPHSFVLGSPRFEPYLGSMTYFGAIVGRVANRISNAETVLDGKVLDFTFNENGRTVLHGGSDGASARNWLVDDHGSDFCRLTLRLPDGQAGFPGNLDTSVTYRLGGNGTLRIEISARTDRITLCNFAHHSYWNLDGTEDLSGHRLTIDATRYLPVDSNLIPLGPPANVAGTRFDFRSPRPVMNGNGDVIDHNFCTDGTSGLMHRHCLLETDSHSLTVRSTEPGLQVYDAGRLSTAPDCGHGGRPYGPYAGLALEPQRWPDAPHQAGYPAILLRPGETYRQISEFQIAAQPRRQ